MGRTSGRAGIAARRWPRRAGGLQPEACCVARLLALQQADASATTKSIFLEKDFLE